MMNSYPHPRRRRPVRLTRRGRVVVFGLCLMLSGAVVAVAAVAAQASPAADPQTVIVQPGDTLWSVVAGHLPSRDAFGMIDEVRRLNDLPDHTVQAGQRLVLPGRR